MSRLSAAMYDWAMDRADTRRLGKWRRELLTEVTGDVVEIGAGTGVNLLHYAEGVQRLVLFEPNRSMRRRAEGRLERSGRPDTEVLEGSAEALAVEDASVDVVVSTLVLCSVSDQAVALAEVWRVLRPGGQLIFLEHVAAPEGSTALRWQQRIDHVWPRVALNCHTTRRTDTAIKDAGFEFERLVSESLDTSPPWIRPAVRGVAIKR